MKRRDFLKGVSAIPVVAIAGNSIGKTNNLGSNEVSHSKSLASRIDEQVRLPTPYKEPAEIISNSPITSDLMRKLLLAGRDKMIYKGRK